jgi:hypothetical protein
MSELSLTSKRHFGCKEMTRADAVELDGLGGLVDCAITLHSSLVFEMEKK